MTVGDLLRNAAAAAPDRVALVDGRVDPTERRQWTYAELLAAAEATARALLARFSPGDRVALWAPNSAEWVIAQQGISLAGMVLVPLNPNYRSQELTYALNQSRAAGLIHADAYRGFDMSGLVTQIRPDLTGMRTVSALPSGPTSSPPGTRHPAADDQSRTTRCRSSTRRGPPGSPRVRCSATTAWPTPRRSPSTRPSSRREASTSTPCRCTTSVVAR